MTVLGTASAVYVGGTAAVAVYAGSVKVWPTAPPPPAGEPADWSFDDISGQLRLSVRSVPEPTVGLAIAVPAGPDPVPNPDNYLGLSTPGGVASLYFYNPGRRAWQVRTPEWMHLTNAQAVAQWGGRTLYVTAVNPAGANTLLLSFDAPTPPPDVPPDTPPGVTPLPPAPPTKPGADGVGQWTMGDAAAPGQLVLAITTPSGPSSASTFTIDIEPFTGTTAEAGNPYRGVVWLNGDRTQRTVLGMAAPVWNGYYPAQWGGHRLRFVIDQVDVLSFTNLGVSPA
jgi:hypothetical protein